MSNIYQSRRKHYRQITNRVIVNINRLSFIRHSCELGFPLDQIRNILVLADNPKRPCAEIAHTHLEAVEAKIKRLQYMKKELKRMIEQCAGGVVSDCRIIEVLSDHSLCLVEHNGE